MYPDSKAGVVDWGVLNGSLEEAMMGERKEWRRCKRKAV